MNQRWLRCLRGATEISTESGGRAGGSPCRVRYSPRRVRRP